MRATTTLVLAAVGLVAAACADPQDPAPVVFRGTDPGGAASAPQPAPPPVAAAPQVAAVDGRGVVDYGGYRAVIARPGDTVASMAARVGLSPAALASYNGLPAGFRPREGDELILPPTPAGAPAVQTAPFDPAPTAPPPAPGPAPGEPAAFDLASIEASLEPPADAEAARPTLSEPAATAPSAPPEVAAPAQPDARPVFAPAPDVAPAPRAAAPQTQPEIVAAQPAPPPPLAAPSASAGGGFVMPANGPIVRPFSTGAGGARSDGVDIAAPTGAPVVSAADGQVALISQALGNLGTIVLIRHDGDLLTVYGRVDAVEVAKGDRVRAGQPIGAVAAPAPGAEPTLHFEVRRGARSVDPADFLPG